MRTQPPLTAPIFRSEGQARILSEILLGDRELGVTDLAAATELAYPTVHREVERLVDAGILAERRVGRTRLLRADEDSPLVPPLREILLVSTGVVAALGHALSAVDGIDQAFIHGPFAARARGIEGPAPRDIDVMVIGPADAEEVFEVCEIVEPVVRRAVRPTVMTNSEWVAAPDVRARVTAGPVLDLIGDRPQWGRANDGS
ncbi:winged helix-turn-helix domain-containing protein [Georgenia sp. Z1491]|uniref:winged helix-turn-helix domain-containing protein n=1 Tax=Georgenia sp. Z1491 TaxID=3416707 RepID=UPI003CF43E2D